MGEKNNLSFFEDYFGFSSPADYAKMFINTSPDENKKKMQQRRKTISNLKDRIT